MCQKLKLRFDYKLVSKSTEKYEFLKFEEIEITGVIFYAYGKYCWILIWHIFPN